MNDRIEWTDWDDVNWIGYLGGAHKYSVIKSADDRYAALYLSFETRQCILLGFFATKLAAVEACEEHAKKGAAK